LLRFPRDNASLNTSVYITAVVISRHCSTDRGAGVSWLLHNNCRLG